MIKGAIIDETKKYRYSLWRIWDESKPKITFIMLNGSTADAENDDPTLRRCIGFAQKWGYGSLEVVNLFGFRTTLPSELKSELYPVGEENEKYIIASLRDADKVILAWGAHGKYMKQDQNVERLLKQYRPNTYCLGMTSEGYPKHPLYLKNDTVPIRYIL